MDQYNRRPNGGYLPHAWYPKSNAAFYSVFRPTTFGQSFQTVTPEETVPEDCNSSSPEPKKIKDYELYAENAPNNRPRRRKKRPRSETREPVKAPASRRPTILYIIIAILAAIIIAGVIVVPIVVTQVIKNIQSKDPPPNSPTTSTASLSGSATVSNMYYDDSLSNNESPLAVLYNKIFCQNAIIPTIKATLPGNSLSCSVQSYSKGSVNIVFTVTTTLQAGQDSGVLQNTMKTALETKLFNTNDLGLQFTSHSFTGNFDGSGPTTQAPATVGQTSTSPSQLHTTANTVQQSNQPGSGPTTQASATVGQTSTSPSQLHTTANTVQQSNQPGSGPTTQAPATVGQTSTGTSQLHTTANTVQQSNQPASSLDIGTTFIDSVTTTRTQQGSAQSASLEGSIRVTSLSYDDALSDPNSDMFKQYEQLVCDNLARIANQSAISPNYRQCVVNKFLNGSLIAVFEVTLEPDGSNNLVEEAAKIFKNFLTNNSTNSSLVVDPASVVIIPYALQSDTLITSTNGNVATVSRSQTTRAATTLPVASTQQRVFQAVTTIPTVNPATTTQQRVSQAATNVPVIDPAPPTQQRVPQAATTFPEVNPATTTQQRVSPAVTTQQRVSQAATTLPVINPATTTQQRVSPAATTLTGVQSTNDDRITSLNRHVDAATSQNAAPVTSPAARPTGPGHTTVTTRQTTTTVQSRAPSDDITTTYNPPNSTTSIPDIACGSSSWLPQGRISSPNYPYGYPAYSNCYTYIYLTSLSTISIVFSSPFEIASCCDYVYIYGSFGVSYAYTGSTVPPLITLNHCTWFRVQFYTYSGYTYYSGFSLTYSKTEPYSCGDDLFTCWSDNRCISNCSRCDGYCDCSDCSDENNYCPLVCRENQFACLNGYQCIPVCKQCDSAYDCYDYSDEQNCNVSCQPPRFQCPYSYNYGSRCLQPCSLCDGINDCGDWSDEYNCTCSPTQFRCRNGQCVLSSARCNGYTQCDDGSDEYSCMDCGQTYYTSDSGVISSPNYPSPYPNNARCWYTIQLDQSYYIGIRFSWPFYLESCCDYVRIDASYCAAGTYTYTGYTLPSVPVIYCSQIQIVFYTDGSVTYSGFSLSYSAHNNSVCPYPDGFACTNGSCIDGSWRCDGYPDCPDGSDERNCSDLCPYEQFQCVSNGWCLLNKFQCYPYNYGWYFKYDACTNDAFVCDGYKDCIDGSDEENCADFPVYHSSTTVSPYYNSGENCSSRVGGYQCASGECLQVLSYDSSHLYHSCNDGSNYNCEKCVWNFHCDGYRDCLDGSDESNCTGIITEHDNSSCSPGQFRCNNSYCINCQYVCNGYSECGDYSDEQDCPCSSYKFRCNNGQCVPSYTRCDGYTQCSDGSDEFNCSCSYYQFRCNNGQCVPSYDRCDGYTDCRDGSDEFNCSCASNQFQCNSGQCVYQSQRCDGYFDCVDNSDELNCTCSAYQFRCANGQCVYASYQCNGYTNCRDGSDESNCSCPDSQFQCDRYYCLSSCKQCDGVVDCPYDSSDEDNCTCDNSTQYLCPQSHKCIPRCKVCDGYNDCFVYNPYYIYDYSDENYCPTVCRANEFKCQSGNQCVKECHRCDGIRHCWDYSDEFNCSCAFNETQCETNGQCINNGSRCDGTLDCADGSDEFGCACQPYQFQCQNGQCIPGWARCENAGYYYCYDKSDEFNCTCDSSHFSCATNGQCVPSSSVCNGWNNCADGSDEQGCENCTRYEFRCPGATTCLNISSWCNNIVDCNDGSDENFYNCGNSGYGFYCPSGFSQCSYYSNQGCYPNGGVCDGILDCPNGNDESYCYCPSDTKFYCDNGLCIYKSKWCDGRNDCSDGSDEPEHCSAKCGWNKIECLNGRCVGHDLVCNGVNNCGDYTDETTCNCSPYYQFNCTNGLCVDSIRWCDGVEDCPDGGDEAPNCVKRCNPGMFTCDNGRCIDVYNRCNGWNDCGDNSDEINCYCGSYAYRCDMGVCVALSTWCDGYHDCPDGSDEPPDCHDRCPLEGLRCNVTGQCMSSVQICDHVRDCPDNSDEIDCHCPIGDQKCTVTGECISPAQICDHVRDCPDNSDEINCPCLSYQYRCTNGNCIYREWLCDGVKDCPLGDDETPNNCDHCNPTTQFRCSSDYRCINIGQQCDGVADCEDSSDEVNCLKLNATGSALDDISAFVRATHSGVPDFYICASQWSSNWSDLACKVMGFQSASSSGNESVDADSFLGATDPVASVTNATLVMTYLNIVSCPSKQAVTLTCQHMECGVRSVPPDSVGPYIVNGDVAARGAWPWQIQFYIDGQFECGGSIINEWWVLTAAHCVAGGYSASDFTVKLGSNTLDGDDCQIHNVAQFFQNPLYGNLGHDNALLLLQSPIQFGDTARPICMPSPSVDLRQFRVCVATGFGRHRYGYQYPVSPILLQAKMNLMSYEACVANALNVTGPNGNSYVTADIDYRVMICAGTTPTKNDINICNGDSGGPLACQDQHGIWTQIGVVSWGFYDPQSIACQNSVFARLPALMDWVQNTIAAYSNF